MKVTGIQLFPVAVAVRPLTEGGIAPYVGSRDATGTSRATAALYKVTTDDGHTGWGEMNLILSLGVTRALLEDFLKPAILGRSPFELNVIKRDLASLYNPDVHTLHFFSGVEMALWDLMGQAAGLPVYKLLGGAVRERIPIAYALGYTDEETTRRKLAQIQAEGYRCLKTKGGFDVEADIRRAALMRELAPGLALRVDMNQGYTFGQAARYLQGVEPYALEYAEQPIRAGCLEDLAVLRSRSATPVAVNEDAYIPGGLARCLRLHAADAAVVDLESAGGMGEMAALAATAQQAGLPLAHHCAWDLGLKTAAILHLCAALPAFSLAMDSTYPNHVGDVLTLPIPVQEGHYPLPPGPGLGVRVNEDFLRKHAIEDSGERFVF